MKNEQNTYFLVIAVLIAAVYNTKSSKSDRVEFSVDSSKIVMEPKDSMLTSVVLATIASENGEPKLGSFPIYEADSVHQPMKPIKMLVSRELTPDYDTWHPRELNRYRIDDIASEWNKLRVMTWRLADSLIREYPVPVSQEQLYDFFMKTYYVESKFDPEAKNKKSTATGLIQWMGDKYGRYGYTRSQFARLGVQGQMKYVGIYYRKMFDRVEDKLPLMDKWEDYYCLVFYPRAAPMPNNYVIATSCTKKAGGSCYLKRKKGRYCTYHANSGYDFDKDGKILKHEIAKRVDAKIASKYKSG